MLFTLLIAGLFSEALAQNSTVSNQTLVVNQKSFNVLKTVPAPSVSNLTTVRSSTFDTDRVT